MQSPHVRTSSYRLQFGPHFGFVDAQRTIPYLQRLGISDGYASPILQSKSGSEHGYDICDHGSLNRELGTPDDFDAFARELADREMGLILDFVPNHMGLDPSANQWWHDVLQHGQASRFADYFDIDWDPVTPELRGRLLLPILEDGYGDVLERGELRLVFADGEFHIQYGDRRLPVEPRSSLSIVQPALSMSAESSNHGSAEWRDYLEILVMLGTLPAELTSDPGARTARHQITATAREKLAALVARSSHVRAFIEGSMACFNGHPGQPSTFDRLHGLLDRQPYRLAHWKTAFDEINYRRFFDVNDLGGLRMEDARVFTAAHRLVLQLIAERKVSALRIDHPDGLLDPAAYLRRLKAATDRALAQTPGPVPHNGCDLLVEKILAPGEFLPETWPVAGTTGYGFLNAVGGLFVDPASADSLRRWYARTARQRDPFEEVVYHSKRLVMGSSMASELAVLARNLKAIAGSDRRTRDFTLTALRKTIVEVVACLPVYRTYVSAAGFSPADRERVDLAIDRARRRNPVMAQSLFRFLRGVLLPDDERLPAERLSAERRFAAKFQQFSAPVQAKGVEDTSFYRYNVLLSLNEVGGDPSGFGTSVEEFHGGNVVRLERWPREMISTATHDSKRGEDARARLNVLTEVPGPWRRSVSAWRRLNAVRRTAVDRQSAPDANDEYCFYQTLVAAWPAEPVDAPVPAEAPQALVERLRAYMLKAIKEAKVHTSWVNQNSAYEEALQRFVETTLRGPGARGFLKTAVPFVRRIAHAGTINSLAQLVLKVASPGVPDFYNGTETWQLDMADPDNRRPVDFPLRDNMLRELMPWLDRLESRQQPIQECPCPGPGEQHVESLLAEWWDSRIKMFLTAAGLRLRRRAPDVFIQGTYEPLRAVGDQAPHLVGFARTYDSEAAVAIVPRLMGGRCFSSGRLPTGPDAWGDTRIVLPAPLARRVFHHAFTGALVGPVEGGLLAADVLRTCPVALLVTEAAGRKFVT